MTTARTDLLDRDDLAAPRITTIPARTSARPPCADTPDNWDLDAGTPEAWRTAVNTCSGCPVLAQCRQLAEMLIARGDYPRSMIWAGTAYDASGHVVDDLDKHRVAALDNKRPMRIIRNGPRPSRIESTSGAPRRHLVLGRPRPPPRARAPRS
ncbi:hypothetical protein [Nocardia cyriacigeorgica]|uniref:hypothetical protein n=1 Tax=Nocardia cyriacigeorgica TaxID=135487 RepID=UPI002453DE6F|nr:hypothetical protein [Nocardia cyriacigeorgica]